MTAAKSKSSPASPTTCPSCGVDREELLGLLSEAASALALCLECERLTWEAELEAEAIYKKLKLRAL